MPDAREVLAALFEKGFERAQEGRPYDYADAVIRCLYEHGLCIGTADEWGDPTTAIQRENLSLHAEIERLREALGEAITMVTALDDANECGAELGRWRTVRSGETSEQRCRHGYGVSEFCAQCRDDESLPDPEEPSDGR